MRRAGLPTRPPSTPGPYLAHDDPEVPLMPPPLGASAGLAAVERYVREVGAHVDGRVRAVQARIEAMQSSGDIPRLRHGPRVVDGLPATAGIMMVPAEAAQEAAALSEARRRRLYGLVQLVLSAARAEAVCPGLDPSGLSTRAQSL